MSNNAYDNPGAQGQLDGILKEMKEMVTSIATNHDAAPGAAQTTSNLSPATPLNTPHH